MTYWHDKTEGGASGHRLRRIIHLSMFVLPLLYCYQGEKVAAFLGLSMQCSLILLAAFISALEIYRLCKGRVIFAQRLHEKGQLSSFFWGALSIILVLLFAGGPAYYIPIITVCAWVDPLLGGLRAREVNPVLFCVVGVGFALIIWGVAHVLWGSELILGFFCSMIAVFFERFNWRHVDDNALMQLAPLIFLVFYSVLF